MGARDDHLAQARANAEFAHRLLHPADVEPDDVAVQWAVTAAFYSAVHYVEAHLAHRDIHSDDHRDRYRNLLAANLDRSLLDAYRSLKDFSQQARYNLRRFAADFARQTVMEKYLARIQRVLDPERQTLRAEQAVA